MHYPRKISKIKKIRKQGFRARMSTSKGRKLLSRQRRIGRTLDMEVLRLGRLRAIEIHPIGRKPAAR